MKDRVAANPNRVLITPDNTAITPYNVTWEYADNPTEEGTLLNKAFGDESFFVTYTHTKTNNVHTLINEDGGNIIKFAASAQFNAGDSFKVNDTDIAHAYTTQGNMLPNRFFVAGAIVLCFINGTDLYFTGGSSIAYASTFTTNDWSAVSGGATMTIEAATHNCGTSPSVDVLKLNGTKYVKQYGHYRDYDWQAEADITGNITIKTTAPFAGKIIVK